VLLRELHHRVRNNLQVVAGPLNLQSSAVVDLRDERPYEANDLHRVPFDLYLQELMDHIRASMEADAIAIEVVAESIALDVDVAIPCGMIVNELVSNAFKHAFAETDSGSVSVCLPDDAQHSLGMTLVHMLAKQIGGTVEVAVKNGTTVRVRLPV
jgi:two-component sensor histidine kinase